MSDTIHDILREMRHYSQFAVTGDSEKELIWKYAERIELVYINSLRGLVDENSHLKSSMSGIVGRMLKECKEIRGRDRISSATSADILHGYATEISSELKKLEEVE